MSDVSLYQFITLIQNDPLTPILMFYMTIALCDVVYVRNDKKHINMSEGLDDIK